MTHTCARARDFGKYPRNQVRDVEESKRVNANVQERLAERIGSEKKREQAG